MTSLAKSILISKFNHTASLQNFIILSLTVPEKTRFTKVSVKHTPRLGSQKKSPVPLWLRVPWENVSHRWRHKRNCKYSSFLMVYPIQVKIRRQIFRDSSPLSLRLKKTNAKLEKIKYYLRDLEVDFVCGKAFI